MARKEKSMVWFYLIFVIAFGGVVLRDGGISQGSVQHPHDHNVKKEVIYG